MNPRDSLDRARITSPCSKDWSKLDSVPGDDARRFCGDCGKAVADLSKLSRREGLQLLDKREHGRVCVLMRLDLAGRVITRPPSAWWRRIAAALAAALPFAGLSGCTEAKTEGGHSPTVTTQPGGSADAPDAALQGDGDAQQDIETELTPELREQLMQLGGMGYF